MKLKNKLTQHFDKVKYFSEIQLWMIQVSLVVALIANALVLLLFVLLGIFDNSAYFVACFGFCVSLFFNIKFLKMFGIPRMGLKTATKELFLPAVERYQKEQEKKL